MLTSTVVVILLGCLRRVNAVCTTASFCLIPNIVVSRSDGDTTFQPLYYNPQSYPDPLPYGYPSLTVKFTNQAPSSNGNLYSYTDQQPYAYSGSATVSPPYQEGSSQYLSQYHATLVQSYSTPAPTSYSSANNYYDYSEYYRNAGTPSPTQGGYTAANPNLYGYSGWNGASMKQNGYNTYSSHPASSATRTHTMSAAPSADTWRNPSSSCPFRKCEKNSYGYQGWNGAPPKQDGYEPLTSRFNNLPTYPSSATYPANYPPPPPSRASSTSNPSSCPYRGCSSNNAASSSLPGIPNRASFGPTQSFEAPSKDGNPAMLLSVVKSLPGFDSN
ncbi:hypothetical protein AB6A40_002736 [Gnathostoma spinigerum]|uniref:Uncharacterized protein n=1 Tax=Gnathostoma spinigerum TaxID=75299 RepID=A0ABD6EHJ0_9BILA